jgi:hypothetical protein
MDVRSYRGASIELSHYLVGIKLRARISSAKISTFEKMKRINVEQLQIEDKAREFKEEIKLSIEECEGEGVELLWQNCKTLKKFLRKCWDLMRDKSETNGMMVNVQKPQK